MLPAKWPHPFLITGLLLPLASLSCVGKQPGFTSKSRTSLDAELNPDASEGLRSGALPGDDDGLNRNNEGDASRIVEGEETVSPSPGDDSGRDAAGSDSSTTEDKQGDSSGVGERDESRRPALSEQFQARATERVAGAFRVEGDFVAQSIALVGEKTARSSTFVQEERSVQMARFVQGQDGRRMNENFEQMEVSGVLDIVLVIDNSLSMEEEQNNLSEKLIPLINAVKDADWRIGIVTTDPNNGCLRQLVERDSSNRQEKFAHGVKAGTAGYWVEQGFRQAVAALECSAVDWVRENSTIAVLIVSDEDNCGWEGTCSFQDPWSHEDYLLDHLEKNMGRRLGYDARVYGILDHPDDGQCSEAENVGYQYARAIAQSKGSWGSICSSDYTDTLTQISNDMASLLRSQFALSHVPNLSSLVATATLPDGSSVSLPDFDVQGAVVTFENPPPLRSNIHFSYKTLPETKHKTWDLGAPPSLQSLELSVDGRQLAKSEYSLSGSLISFNTVPAPGSVWEASFKLDRPLPFDFSLDGDVEASSVKVQVNGQSVASFGFDKATGLVNLDDAPEEGSEIHITYEAYSAPAIRYPALVPVESPLDVAATYADGTEVTLEFLLDDGRPYVQFADARELRPGESLEVVYQVAQTPSAYLLPALPLAGSFTLESTSYACSFGAGLERKGQVLTLDCPGAAPFEVRYAFEADNPKTRDFALSEALAKAKGLHAVFVDEVKIKEDDFDKKDGVLRLKKGVSMKHGSVVRLVVYPDET